VTCRVLSHLRPICALSYVDSAPICPDPSSLTSPPNAFYNPCLSTTPIYQTPVRALSAQDLRLSLAPFSAPRKDAFSSKRVFFLLHNRTPLRARSRTQFVLPMAHFYTLLTTPNVLWAVPPPASATFFRRHLATLTPLFYHHLAYLGGYLPVFRQFYTLNCSPLLLRQPGRRHGRPDRRPRQPAQLRKPPRNARATHPHLLPQSQRQS
jgi:hypothetical protein